MFLSLVKRERLWYTVAMKAFLFDIKPLCFCLLTILLASALCCVPIAAEEWEAPDAQSELEADEEYTSSCVVFTIDSIDPSTDTDSRGKGEVVLETVCESEHAVVFVSAHAIDETAAKDLLRSFEEQMLPMLPLPEFAREERISIALTYMDGRTYGYTLCSEEQQGQVIFLNALYPEDLAYTLAHEYQHLCAYLACKAGKTALSEETDELLSDVFCELLFPGYGRERGILSEQRSLAAQERIKAWGTDAVSHVHALLREGYTEEKILLAMEDR